LFYRHFTAIANRIIDKDLAALQAHLAAPYYAKGGELLVKEGLLAKPLEVLKLNLIGGFSAGGK